MTHHDADVAEAGSPSPAAAASCLVCGAKLRPSHLPGLLKCAACGFVTADVQLTDEELKALYGQSYFHGQEYLDYSAEEKSLRRNFARRLRTLRQIAPELHEQSLFEIGCAYGFFLDEARGAAKSVKGMDISAGAISYARTVLGLDVHEGNYLDRKMTEKFDVIAMWDTVEHLKRPDLFISKISANLRPGGLFALTTGDIDSINARMRGKGWRMIHPPTHLHYFSLRTMTALLDRHGFDVVHVSYPGVWRNLRSILYYTLAWRSRKSKLYDMFRDWKVFDLGISVNMFDIMYVIARRRRDWVASK